MRLMVPFFVAIFLFLVPRLYLSQEYAPFHRIDGKIEWNLLKYYIGILPTIYGKLSWLWFLLGLFIDSQVNYPLLVWSQRRKKKLPIEIFGQDG